jgi:hypothetical protein
MATKNILTKPFRLSFPNVFQPKAAVQGGKEEFSIVMLFKKDDPAVRDLRALLKDAITEKWGEDKTKWPPNLRNMNLATHVSVNGKDGWPIVDGDMKSYEGYAGMLSIRAKSGYKPGVVSRDLEDIINPREVVGGLIARAEINAWAYNHPTGGPGVSFGLQNLQILKDDGVRFSGKAASNPKDVFGAWEDDYAGTGTDDDL